MKRPRKVLILGASGFQRSDEYTKIECYAWNQVPKISNSSDYDVIIINLVSLTDWDSVDWKDFFDKFAVQVALEVLINYGRIIVIGDPRFSVNVPVHVHLKDGYTETQFLSWTGVEFDWDNREGDTKKCNEKDQVTKSYLNYLEKISYWNYALRGCSVSQLQSANIGKVLGKGNTEFRSEIELERICENRYGGHVVFAIRLSILENQEVPPRGDIQPVVTRQGRIIFLPRIDLPDDDVVAMVLADILRIRIVVPEPPWASAIVAPGQPQIDKEIAQIEQDVAQLREGLDNAVGRREAARRYVHLLYKMHDELEDVVRETLRLLGSEIEPPSVRGREDGWLEVRIENKTFRAVLEIKGTRKDQFSIDGIRQLMDWKSQGKYDRGNDYKGIFIGCSAVEKPCSEREVPFTEDWKKRAKRTETVGLDSRDLYQLYCLDCKGHLDRDRFWKTLFETNGVFDVKPFSE